MAQLNQDSKHSEPEAKTTLESTAGTSSGSSVVDKDVAADMAAPYGTRSRNRSGNPRPNYAEDKDIEMDVYDFYQDKKDGDGSKKSSRQASAAAAAAAAAATATGAAANGEATRGAGSSRKPVPDDSKTASNQNGSREQSSSASTGAPPPQQVQATNASQPSRKRKAASQAVGVTINTASSTATANATAGARKGGNAAPNPGTTWAESNMLTFENCKSRLDNGRMVADDGTVLEPNDHVYLVCEPPGEPYYLGRIMEFLQAQNDSSKPVDAVRINWYYRPKDIGRKVHDTRLVFATMHSDISPLTALRGKCQIRHRVEIESMDEYRKTPDSFWFEKLYDRYIQKNYDLIPTRTIVNVPEKVKTVLDERWKYVLVEQGRGKELTSAVKLCKRCSGYCASNDSVDCAVCRYTYHMNCVKPPLLKKPSRGFAWSCAACSRAQERKLEARHTPNTIHGDGDDDEFLDEDDDDPRGIATDRTSPADGEEAHHEGTAEQIYQASLWPWRYLGMHCKPEDALDYDDRIYPRASTRIGPKHQANVSIWPGNPVQYVKPLETRRGGKKDPKLSKEAQAAQDAEKARRGKRPKWIQDQPSGYVARGEDYDANDPNCTATLMWKPPSTDEISVGDMAKYMAQATGLAKKLDLPERSTNLQDVAVTTLFHEKYDEAKAASVLSRANKTGFKEPILTAAEQKRFEEGVSRYGSELHLVMKHVKSMTPGEVVRYYYTWKKTDRGQQIWGSYPGRKGKKQARQAEAAATKMADDVADNDDDSAFDTDKATEKKRGFICHFCSTTSSRQWRRAPNASQGLVNGDGLKTGGKDKGTQYVVALCRRCAELWRRYAIRWEDIEEVAKKVAQAGGRAWKRKQDEELLKELQAAKELGFMTPERASTPLIVTAPPSTTQEPPRKKLKGAPQEKEADPVQSDGGSASGTATTKKKEKPVAVVEAPHVPEMPKPRTLPCAICDQMEPLGDQHISCRECRLTVHRNCYGVIELRNPGKWTCDMCANDKSPQVSIQYKCVLCPVEHTEHDFVEQPKLTHHKKKMSEKDREREKVEVQQARKAADFYRKRQEEMNRPVNPREPLKRTADNNWVHVTCAVWTPEVKFGNAKALEPSEGIPSIPRARYDEVCQACNSLGGACVSCHQCRIPLHVECARQQGHVLGFEISPVKSSRRDQFSIVTINGESGTMSATVWCKDHAPTKTVVHRMHESVNDSGLNALQLYVQNYKQADLTLTGTVRKATLMTMAAKMSGVPLQAGNRRASTTTAPNGTWTQTPHIGESQDAASNAQQPGEKVCITCGIDVTPRWWPIDNSQERRLTNGHHGTIGSEAQKFVEQRKFQCHKCHKHQRSPRQPPSMPSPDSREAFLTRLPVPEPSLMANVCAPSPPQPPPLPPSDYRDGRPPSRAHAWPQPPGSHPVAVAVAATASGPPPLHHPVHQLQPPPQTPTHVTGHRPTPVTHAYPPAGLPARAPPYSDWGHRPGSQHGSPPPRPLNGGPPQPLHAGPPPPISNLSSLRPPAMSGPPPNGPLQVTHPHSHTSPIFGNGPPPSPHRLNGPTPPGPYIPPYHGPVGHINHGGPHGPSHGPSHSLNNGVPPPPTRADVFSHGLHPQRPQFPGVHGSPPVSRNGLVPSHEQPVPRPPESRPASGASASPSLRNLLS